MTERKCVSRRQFLHVVGLQAAAVALAACAPKAAESPTQPPAQAATSAPAAAATEAPAPTALPAATPEPAQAAVEIQFDAGGYTPSKYTGQALQEGQTEIKAFDEVANAYMANHTNVKIKFMPNPMGNRRDAMITALTAGTAPDLMWTQPDWVNEDLGKNWWLNLDPYLEMPNPYDPPDNPGSKVWHDSFYPSVDFWRAPDGHLYMLLGDQTQVGIYYNKDIFSKAGISEEPKLWSEMIAACEAIKKNLNMPGFAWCGGGNGELDQLTWVSGWLSKYFFWNYIKKYDENGNGWADKWEMADAIKAGTYSAHMEEQVARLRTLKAMAAYWQDGALGVDWEPAYRLFLTGGGSMIITGVWQLNAFLNDPDRKFDLGWFYFPAVDQATWSGVPANVPLTNVASGYGSFQYALTATALKKGTADTCADFLMFSTTPENIGKIVDETPQTIPNVKGAPLNPLTVKMGFAESITYPPSSFQEDDSLLDYEYGQNFASVVLPYCVGQLDEASMLDQLQGYMNAAADRVLASRPKQ